MHTVFALLCFVVVIHWLIFPYPSGLLHWHCGNLTIAPVPAKQPWWIWINASCEFIMNDCITTTKQSTTKPCAYFLGYTVLSNVYTYMIGLEWVSFYVKIKGKHLLLDNLQGYLDSIQSRFCWLLYTINKIGFDGTLYITLWATAEKMLTLNTLRPRQKWPPCLRRHFQMHFPEWKRLNYA